MACAGLIQLALTGDGAFIGLAIAYVAVRRIIKFTTTSAALKKIRDAPSVHVRDHRSIASLFRGSNRERILVVRGMIHSKYVAESTCGFELLCRALIQPTITAELSGEAAVIYKRIQRFVYNESKHFRPLFARSLKEVEDEFSSTNVIPFVLTHDMPIYDGYVAVNMGGSKHPLPLVSVYHELRHISSTSPYTLLHALFGYENPVGILDQEKILPLRSDITAVGYASFKGRIGEIRPCNDLPYFLSNLSKNEMLENLNSEAKVQLWSGIVFGSFAIAILSYAAMRSWPRWKGRWKGRWKEWWQHWREVLELNRDEAPPRGGRGTGTW